LEDNSRESVKIVDSLVICCFNAKIVQLAMAEVTVIQVVVEYFVRIVTRKGMTRKVVSS
jgi:hypothetical protein